ncbi:MAG: hypothetical protein LBS84_02755 [Clostridiales bacterium]|jgi:hypothetical protein|nr:hypothetical protein [Clostridiales bacterium]
MLSWWSREPYGYAVIYRSDSAGGQFSRLAAMRSAPFLDTGLTAGRTYYYKIQLVSGLHPGELSSALAVTAY